MGNYEQLKQAVSDVIKTNENQEITGAIMQNTLLSIISTVGSNATFAGIATPTTNPGTPDQNLFYLASQPGIYSNFGGIEIKNKVLIITNKDGNWKSFDTGIASNGKISDLKSKLNNTSFLFLENGGINLTTGQIENNNLRVRTNGFIKAPFTIELNTNYKFIGVCKYDIENKTHLGKVSFDSQTKKIDISDQDFIYKISFGNINNSEIDESEDIIYLYKGSIELQVSQNTNDIVQNTNDIVQNTNDIVQNKNDIVQNKNDIVQNKNDIVQNKNDIVQNTNDIVQNTNDIGKRLILEVGSVNVSSGKLEDGLKRRLRTKKFIETPINITCSQGFNIKAVVKYEKNGSFVSGQLIDNKVVSLCKDNYFYKISFCKEDDTQNILLSEISFDKVEYSICADVSSLNNDVSSLKSDVLSLNRNFSSEEIKGVPPINIIYQNVNKLCDGNVGVEFGDKSNNTQSKIYYVLQSNEWSNTYNYVLFAAILYGINDESFISLSLNDGKVTPLLNYGINYHYSNVIKSAAIKINDGVFLLYCLSGRIESQGNNLPTTGYIRVLGNTNGITFGISKMYMCEIEQWKDEYENILISDAITDSIWDRIIKISVPNDSFIQEIKNKLSDDLGVLKRKVQSGITFWGSSSAESDWVKTVALNLNMNYYWGGVGGENIFAILGRMGVLPLRLKQSITIPATTDNVEFPDNYKFSVRWKGQDKDVVIWVSQTVQDYKLLVNPCYIAGVKGNLVGKGANSDVTLGFQRLEAGEEITTNAYEPIYTYGFQQTRDSVWFLACHFNGGESSINELVELYQKCYEKSESKKVLILGRHRVANGREITQPELSYLQEQETALYDEFGLMFFNTRQYMCTYGFVKAKKIFENDPLFVVTQQDETDASNGITPNCFYNYANDVHFNKYGYDILTDAITERFKELGYNLFRYEGEMNFPVY